jgi:hypothetical protein
LSNKLELFDNKIVILYILDNSSMPLTTDQIAKFCEEFEDITYFDICIYLEDLKSNGYINLKYDKNLVMTFQINNKKHSKLKLKPLFTILLVIFYLNYLNYLNF